VLATAADAGMGTIEATNEKLVLIRKDDAA
jgi:hypothetical protein